MTLVRAHIPPSYKTATNRANYHWVVIGFGQEPSNRLGLIPPYDKIYCWYCFNCPALNGSMGMDRHLSALLQGLSFPEEYHSTALPVNTLNTVVSVQRQVTDILPSHISSDIAQNITRRSMNTRSRLSVYDLTSHVQPSYSTVPSVPAVVNASNVTNNPSITTAVSTYPCVDSRTVTRPVTNICVGGITVTTTNSTGSTNVSVGCFKIRKSSKFKKSKSFSH